ncbi:transcriptional regulator [Stutzerimonas nosocomialis]|uniref:Transcriptional regulator n=1 Tax=Stutzerimonas nosocomialis TaxID=1056496 RepID=A0A5R9QJT5_9GAMM|nr:SoxR reducing system RseC family protein [Stutzerimonas nosocomialis]TLX54694.1 transcriptional regulator [Stutzerimonas nosocomialis]TLX65567.1 transcriptional regulator [Stutzerimonas nosocomialis]
MIEERGRVVAVETGGVWVETLQKTTCSGCSVRSGCGQGLMDRLGVRERRHRVFAASDLVLGVGDQVTVGVPEAALLRGAVTVYLVPLLALFASAFLFSCLSFGEPVVILGGLSGFALAWLWVWRRNLRAGDEVSLRPVVLRAMLVDPQGAS